MPLDPYTLLGCLGTLAMVGAYFVNQQRWLRSDDWRFPAANLAGALLVLVSLSHDWNLPSVLVETFWAAISVWGLAKARRRE